MSCGVSAIYLNHFSGGAVWQEGLPARILPEGVGVVPVVLVPCRQKPDISLSLGHSLLVRLANDVARRRLEELADDYAHSALSQVVQVLEK